MEVIQEFLVLIHDVGECRAEWVNRGKCILTESGRLAGGAYGFFVVEWGVGGSWNTYAVGKRSGGEHYQTNRWFFTHFRTSLSRKEALRGLGASPKRNVKVPDRTGAFEGFVRWIGAYQPHLFSVAQEQDISAPFMGHDNKGVRE